MIADAEGVETPRGGWVLSLNPIGAGWAGDLRALRPGIAAFAGQPPLSTAAL